MADPTTPAGFNGTNGSPHAHDRASHRAGGRSGPRLQSGPRFLGTVSEVCQGFLAGTHIATPEGEVPVERLAIGHPVLTLNGNAGRVLLISVAQVLASPGWHGPANPIIVLKGALADDVPNRDLRLTKAAALYLDGGPIPVELLVNHRTILWDNDAREITIYHLQLETRDVLLANGAPAEIFRGHAADRPAANGSGLLTGGPEVDAAWMRLLQRAGGQRVATTGDPDLYLRVDGRRVNATSRGDDWYRFGLAAKPNEVRIVSRSGVPQELGVSRDPRRLGVAVRQVVALKGRMVRTIEADDPSLLEGFHAFETNTGFRWTDGDASVPVSLFDRFIGPLEVFLRIGGSATYAADLRTRRAGRQGAGAEAGQ